MTKEARVAPACLLVLAACSFSLTTCTRDAPTPAWTPADFENVLDLGGSPGGADDLTSFAFSDLGSWHMFGLPDPAVDTLPGSFSGPLLLSDGGVWLSSSLLRPEIEVEGVSASLAWKVGHPGPVTLYPGRLNQAMVAGDLAVDLDLVFDSPESSLIRATLTNRGPRPLEVRIDWSGKDFLLPVELEAEGNGVAIQISGSGTRVLVSPLSQPSSVAILDDPPWEYLIRGSLLRIPTGGVARRFVQVRVLSRPDRVAVSARGPGNPNSLDDPERVFHETRTRWVSYLGGVLGRRDVPAPSGPGVEQRIAVKALVTLISNWRSARGHLFHDGLFPSYAYRGFHGIWSWDSWKHARALSLFAPELAKDQMRVMFDFQNEAGMIPDVIYVDSAANNWRDSKPPLAAWAVQGIFHGTADTAFVAEIYPSLKAYHEWWYRDRDHDGNGLCEYGSTDGTRIAAAWESGMDNAVRFDSATMVQNGLAAWSLNQESVDLNAYLYAEKGYLAELAEVLGLREDARAFLDEAEGLGRLIRAFMYDEGTGFFHDIRLETKEPIRVQGPEGWIPLWAGLATPEQAGSVARAMADPSKFSGKVPLPTLAMDHPEFDPSDGYWRGPVWLDQAYFGIKGLETYGFTDLAERFRDRILLASKGLSEDLPIFENYHPLTGEGLNAPHFSWSAAHLLMLLSRVE